MLVDSNILVYAINSASTKHQKARQFLQDRQHNLELAHQNIFETLRVLTHPKFPHPMRPKQAIEALEQIMEGCRIVHPDYGTHGVALEMVRVYNLKADKIFDAYLVATALSNGIWEIASDNIKDLQKFKEIKVINPFTLEAN